MAQDLEIITTDLTFSPDADEISIEVDAQSVPLSIIPRREITTDLGRELRTQYEQLFRGIILGRREEVSAKALQLRALILAAETGCYETFHPSPYPESRVISMDSWLSLLNTKLGVPFAAKSTLFDKIRQVRQLEATGIEFDRAVEIAADKPYAIEQPIKVGAFTFEKDGEGIDAKYTVIVQDAPEGKAGMGLGNTPKDYIEWLTTNPPSVAAAIASHDFGRTSMTCSYVRIVDGAPQNLVPDEYVWAELEMKSTNGNNPEGTPLKGWMCLEKDAVPNEMKMFVRKVKPSWTG